jgi:hypothetical protein
MSIEKNKSVVEEALLQIKAVEEAISENAKGILASTMKQEISELVKESLSGSRKTKKSLYEQEEDPNLDNEDDTEDDNDEIDPTMGDETDVTVDDELDDEGDEEVNVSVSANPVGDNEMAPLDMTQASPAEVLKVFKAMGDNDGIIVKKDGGYIHLSDNETDKDYLIQTEGYKRSRNMNRSRINESMFSDFDFEPSDFDDMKGFEKLDRMKSSGRGTEEDEYELEFDDDMPMKPMRSMKKHSKYADLDEMDEEEMSTIYELEVDDLYTEAFKPVIGNKGKNKFKYPKSLKRGVTETSDDEDELEENWEMDEDTDGVFIPSSPKKMKESFKPKGNVGKMKFSYPKSLKRGVTETSDDEDELGEGWEMDEQSATDAYAAAGAPTNGNPTGKTGTMTGETTEGSRTITYGRRSERGRVASPSQVRNESYGREMNLLREKNEEYKKALDFFRNKLNEVAVFNSNLAYSTRLFTEHSTTKQEKINILRRFDNVESMKESKNLYQSIKKELDGKGGNSVVTESIQTRVSRTPQSGSATNLIESKTYENPQFMRMRDLMDKIK